ncbi:amino acid permease [Streptomyces sp. NPDC001292]|uniref:amino acid permease n=1 Tax=Streptomyces sp. NPDC001292 TaxID=3364558 RepID=UPI0036779BBA
MAIAFLVFAVRAIATHGESFGTTGWDPTSVSLPDLLSGASLLALSFLGFDAVSTLSEEAERPRRDIPRAILLIVAAAGVFFLAITYAMQTLFPDVSAVGNIVGASPEIAEYIGGAAFQAVFVGGYLTAVLRHAGHGEPLAHRTRRHRAGHRDRRRPRTGPGRHRRVTVAPQPEAAPAARLLFAMGRDGMLPRATRSHRRLRRLPGALGGV